MKKTSLFLLLASLTTSIAQPPSTATSIPNWVQIPEFSDEFNGSTLDTSKWHTFRFSNDEFENGTGIDALSRDRSSVIAMLAPPNTAASNVALTQHQGADCLELKLRDDNLAYAGSHYSSMYHSHTGAALQSNRHLKFGYLEIRAKMAPTAVSSAFWLDCSTPVHQREFDIFELYGTTQREGFDAQGNYAHSLPLTNNLTSNFHLWRNCASGNYFDFSALTNYSSDYGNGFTTEPGPLAAIPNADQFNHTTQFHTYGCLWEKDRIQIFVDGQLVNSIDPQTVLSFRSTETDNLGNLAEYGWNVPMAICYTLEIFDFFTTNDSYAGRGNENVENASYYVDYIRVWRPEIISNLVDNGNFDSGTTNGWQLQNSSGASSQFSYEGSLAFWNTDNTWISDGAPSDAVPARYEETASQIGRLSVSGAGSQRSDVTLSSSVFTLEPNNTYGLSFALRQDTPGDKSDQRLIRVVVSELNNPGNVIFESEEYVDHEWANVNHVFETGSTTSGGYELRFECGGQSAQPGCAYPDLFANQILPNTGEYFIDEVSLGKTGPSSNHCTGEPLPVVTIDAYDTNASSGVTIYADWGVAEVGVGDYLRFDDIDLTSGYNDFAILYSSPYQGAFEVRLGSINGEVLDTIVYGSSGGWDIEDLAAIGGELPARNDSAASVFIVQTAGDSNLFTIHFGNEEDQEQTGFDQWICGYSVDAKGLEDDPDGDGLVNLLEYAFYLSPGDAKSRSTPDVILNQSGQLTVSFSNPRNDLTYVVQGSNDLNIWNDLGTLSENGLLSVVDSASVSSVNARFMRISVTTVAE